MTIFLQGVMFGAKEGVAKECARLRAKRGVSDVRSENAVFPRAYGAFQRMMETRRTAGRFSERTGVSRINKSRAFRGDAISLLLIASLMRDANGRGICGLNGRRRARS